MTSPARFTTHPERGIPKWTTSDTHTVGKAILADLPDSRIEEIVKQWGLPPKTDKTITTMNKLWEELEQIREQVIAYSDEEFARGLLDVARCVKNLNDNCLGSIAVIRSAYRIDSLKFNNKILNIDIK